MNNSRHCECSEAIQPVRTILDCRVAALLAMTIFLVLPACANKGKLLSPSQIEAKQEKEAKRAKEKAEEATPDDATENQPEQQ